MSAEAPSTKDWWDKWESVAKILAGVCAAVGAIAIPWFINQYTEANRKSQVYVQMMTEREKSDTSIRENMFKALLDGYLQTLKEDVKREDLESFRKRIVFLELLAVNFQEFFNAKPLFEEVYEKLVKHRDAAKDEPSRSAWMALEKKITGVSKETASRQATTLNTIGDSVVFTMRKGEMGCVRLYEKVGIETLRKRDGITRFKSFENGECLRGREEQEEGKAGTPTPMSQDQNGTQSLIARGYDKRQSIELRVVEVTEASAAVQVTVYADFFDGTRYVGSEPGRGFPVNVSYFDLPYMDNIKLADGNRFALILKGIYRGSGGDESAEADIEAIRFRNDFMSLRDRPLFEEMLKKLQQSPTTR
ncbi:MAG: hypothetical protein OEW25_04195 [Nitrospira sp.]|nr:hypothetical protein [Nitrospira sp.]MDH5252505.1 hypothetical protein [Nitrospira sp.]